MTDPPHPVRTAGGDDAYAPADLAEATGGRLLRTGGRPIRGAAVDSRRVTADVAFVALPGTRTDGHEFLEEAAAAGAAALVVSRDLPADRLEDLDRIGRGLSILRVEDGLRALQAAASSWRERFAPLVVGVTGSLAKTSTKEAIAEVLATRWRVLRSEGNENNEIGLPITLLRLTGRDDVAVLEMGMYVTGEIRVLAELAHPRIGVVTAVRGTHLSRAGSIEAIEQGKGELVEALPADGTAILNADDTRVRRMAALTPARVLTYGFSEEADVSAEAVESLGADGMRFVVRAHGRREPMVTAALGRHSVHNALAAAAVGLAAGLELDEVARGLRAGFSAPHRTTLIEAGSWRILDDSYNAGPDSMAAALELLAALPGRHVAVLGEMLELGEATAEAHRQVGGLAGAVAELLVVVGEGAGGIAEGARSGGLDQSRILLAADAQAAFESLRPRLEHGDVVLVKASRGLELDRLVERLQHAGDPAFAPAAGTDR